MKVAIVTDSNSGITQDQGREMGVYVLPMPFMINQKTYFEDIDLTQEEFYQKLEGGDDISTSQPSPDSVMTLWEQVLETHDQLVHIPMSSGLSGSCETAVMLSRDYDGKVEVANNQKISVTQRQSVLDAIEMVKKGWNAKEIKEALEKAKHDSSIYITVDTLKYLKKGGRITPAAAALGTLLKIKPVLTIQGERLDAFAKARTMKQAKSTMVTALTHDMESRFNQKAGKDIHLYIAHTNCPELAEDFKRELELLFPETGEIHVDALSLSVSCHIGPGALAVACAKKMDD